VSHTPHETVVLELERRLPRLWQLLALTFVRTNELIGAND